jgi:adenosylmethionine-8-amino-7-oxononanoate aminotransferase
MTHVFHRDQRIAYPVAVRGDGCYLIDSHGRRYLDAAAGAAVSCLGHSDAEVVAAIEAQLRRLPYAVTSFFTTEPAEELADLLASDAPAGLDKVWFALDGSEAVESALKLARQWAIETGQPQRRAIISRRQSYHGNTLGALSAGGNAVRRAPYEPLLVPMHHVSPCYPYREQQAGESDAAYGERLARELEHEMDRLGGSSVLAFVAETVVGATLGSACAVPGYFRHVREICDRHGALLILDEVMCGLGRTGYMHACLADDVVPDLLCLAKGLGGGYQPVGAVLIHRKISEVVAYGSGEFQHGHTFMGHAAACAGALAVQKAIRQRGLVDLVRKRGWSLERRLRERFGGHPYVGDIRGRGLFWTLELVRVQETKEPFARDAGLQVRIKAEAMQRGLTCYPMPGCIDGERGDHVLLAPPFIITEPQLDELVDKLAPAIDSAIESCIASGK